MVNLAGAPVAKEIIEPLESARQVGVTAAINNIDALAGVGVEETKAVLKIGLVVRRFGDRLACREGNDQSGKEREMQKRSHCFLLTALSKNDRRELTSNNNCTGSRR